MDAADWLRLVCWTWVWGLLCSALCFAFPLASFLFPFPSQFLFVVGENCASMRSKAFPVKWPVFKCSRGALLNCSNKLLLKMKMWDAVSVELGVSALGKAFPSRGAEWQIWLKLWLSSSLVSQFESLSSEGSRPDISGFQRNSIHSNSLYRMKRQSRLAFMLTVLIHQHFPCLSSNTIGRLMLFSTIGILNTCSFSAHINLGIQQDSAKPFSWRVKITP